MGNSNPILLVEDDPADAMMVGRAFKELNVTSPLVNSNNGREALKYLGDESNKKPCIILLDSNMPKMNGIEFLKAVKADNLYWTLSELPNMQDTTSI